MIKIVNYSIRIFIIVFVLLVAKSSTTVYSVDIENDNTNKTINLLTMAMKVDEVNAYLKEQEALKYRYTGDLTGYAYDCPLCNGTLGCLPKYFIKDGTITYNDIEYGEVRIVASSSKIPCGSIISFDSARISDKRVYAIVLDRGVLNYDIDLLTPSEKYAADYVGRSKITYDVVRRGWE